MAKSRGRSKTTKPKRNTPLPGVSLEQAVARIQRLMSPDATVTHNETIEDRFGNWRQFDVVIRGQFGGHPALGVIECKDHNRKKGPDAVEAFAKKAENVGANLKVMVSRLGFTEQALNLAKKEFIGCLSLMPNDPMQVGWSIGSFWYGTIRLWTDVRLHVYFACETPPITDFAGDSVLWQGLPVSRWFLRHWFSVPEDGLKPNDTYKFGLRFDQVRMLTLNGSEYPVKGLLSEARWTIAKKRQWVSWVGDAFYDWHKEALAVPANTSIHSLAVATDLATWDDFDGEIPTMEALAKQQWMTGVLSNKQQFPSDLPVPELMDL